ncbi:MAG TPA: hypothetical protein VGL58_02655 [Caulobacteraceae bacterium]|jgi:hypothetical protein
MTNPSLEAFEVAAASRDTHAALVACLHILKSVDDRYGRIDMIEAGTLAQGAQRGPRLTTRFAAALGEVIADPNVTLAPVLYEQLTMHHRWIELMFAASGFGSADHLVPLLAKGPPEARRVEKADLAKFLVLFSPGAGMNLNLEEALAADAPSAMSAFLGYLGTRFCFTRGGHAFRERLLEWLPGKIGSVKLGQLALQTIASPFMHCSYAMTPRKHDIKIDLLAQMRRAVLEAGAQEYDPATAAPKPGKPTIVVTTENFTDGHSIHRTHSLSVRALKERFHVVGMTYAGHISPPIEECFDEIIPYDGSVSFLQSIAKMSGQILERQPAMVLHLGVGMSPYVIGLASLRLSPIQGCSFGHTASTFSPYIDYQVLPEDFIGDPKTFSEQLWLVPPQAMPYLPRNDVDFAAVRENAKANPRNDGKVHIAVAASAMKLGPPFFDALLSAAQKFEKPAEFHVFPLGCAGLGYYELKRVLEPWVPGAVVHEEMIYGPYMEALAACDFFICPFPYGNMNSIIDAVLVGLPGVCLDGPEAHAHADLAYFERMGFPEELSTKTLDEYVAAIARLVNDPTWLAKCKKVAQGVDLDKAFFTGDASIFADRVWELVQTHDAAKAARTPELETAS